MIPCIVWKAGDTDIYKQNHFKSEIESYNSLPSSHDNSSTATSCGTTCKYIDKCKTVNDGQNVLSETWNYL